MEKHNFAFIDIETTGQNVLKHEILEIGCVVTDPELKVIEEFEIKIKPERIEDADPVALKINHYDPLNWQNAVSLKDAMQALISKVKDCIMVGQNVAFDSGFIEYAFAKCDIANTMHYHKLDTLSMAFVKLRNVPEVAHYSLHELSKYFGISHMDAHTGLGDARATYELYKKLMNL